MVAEGRKGTASVVQDVKIAVKLLELARDGVDAAAQDRIDFALMQLRPLVSGGPRDGCFETADQR
jgi:hypothetical protein